VSLETSARKEGAVAVVGECDHRNPEKNQKEETLSQRERERAYRQMQIERERVRKIPASGVQHGTKKTEVK
jgi:hypothetical protein